MARLRGTGIAAVNYPTGMNLGGDPSQALIPATPRGALVVPLSAPDLAQGLKTVIGSHCNFLAYSHVAHDCTIGDHVIFSNCGTIAGHVIVEDHATVGGLSGIHPYTRIGTYAYVGGCSKVVQDVPPFVMADGIPARARAVNVVGMRRAGIDATGRRQVKAAFRVLYRSRLAPRSAVARIKAELGDDPLVARLVTFIEASRLGIVAAGAAGTPDTASEERVQ